MDARTNAIYTDSVPVAHCVTDTDPFYDPNFHTHCRTIIDGNKRTRQLYGHAHENPDGDTFPHSDDHPDP